MPAFLTPIFFIITSIAGCLKQHQQHAIDYLIEENRVLREQIGDRRLRFTDDQLPRRRIVAHPPRLLILGEAVRQPPACLSFSISVI